MTGMAEYIEIPLSGRLRGVTYENGKVTDVHIMDTDDVVKAFVPARHGRWIEPQRLYYGAKQYECSLCWAEAFWDKHEITEKYQYCPNCGARMDGGESNGC